MKRLVIVVVLLLFVAGAVTIGWTLADLPPVRYLVRYGLHPRCEATGETVVIEGIRFVEIGPGIFRMGSTHLARDGDWLGRICAPLGLPCGDHPKPSNEMPVHWVEFRRGFWIAETELTNAQYERFEPKRERAFLHGRGGDDDPAVDLHWEDARRYCVWLSEKTERLIRLPSEAEWECACRAGSDGRFCFGNDVAELAKYAWFEENSEHRAHEVATKQANRWGLYDLHGNACEWCEDILHDSYKDAPSDGMAWIEGGFVWRDMSFRVLRGGCWFCPAVDCRSAIRHWALSPCTNWVLGGFRLAFSPPPSED